MSERIEKRLHRAAQTYRKLGNRSAENMFLEAEETIVELRQLVRDLWEYIYIGTAQDGQSLHDRTRELGIEVDE